MVRLSGNARRALADRLFKRRPLGRSSRTGKPRPPLECSECFAIRSTDSRELNCRIMNRSRHDMLERFLIIQQNGRLGTVGECPRIELSMLFECLDGLDVAPPDQGYP